MTYRINASDIMMDLKLKRKKVPLPEMGNVGRGVRGDLRFQKVVESTRQCTLKGHSRLMHSLGYHSFTLK